MDLAHCSEWFSAINTRDIHQLRRNVVYGTWPLFALLSIHLVRPRQLGMATSFLSLVVEAHITNKVTTMSSLQWA